MFTRFQLTFWLSFDTFDSNPFETRLKHLQSLRKMEAMAESWSWSVGLVPKMVDHQVIMGFHGFYRFSIVKLAINIHMYIYICINRYTWDYVGFRWFYT